MDRNSVYFMTINVESSVELYMTYFPIYATLR